MATRPRTGRTVVLALAAFLAACAAPPPAAPLRSELVMGIVGDPVALLEDPAAAAVAALLVEPLVRRTATEDLEPRLAESVPTIANGSAAIRIEAGDPRLIADFRIREGARWHDGAPVTAEDVRFAFDQDRAAQEGSAARAVADRMERMDMVDDRTVRVTYRAGERWDLYALGPRAMPRHLLESAAARADYERVPRHAGPYRIAERVPGRITLVPFEGYVAGRPEIDRIVVRAFDDRTALLAAFGRRAIDVIPHPALDADLARTLDRSADGSSHQVLYTQTQQVAMLRLGGHFTEPGLRQAISLAVDRDRISRAVFAGRVRAPTTYIVPPLWAAAELGPPRGPDREAARAHLASARYRRGAFGIAERDGAQLVGTLLVPRGSIALEGVARSVAGDLAAIGVAVDVSERDLTDVEDRVRRGDFDLAVLAEPADDPLLATERYRGLVAPWSDVLADAARAAAGRAEQGALYAELQRLWSAAAPAVPLYQVLKVDVVPARLQNVRATAHSVPLTWNAAAWRLAPPP